LLTLALHDASENPPKPLRSKLLPLRAFITIWIHVWMSAGGGARSSTYFRCADQNVSYARGQSCVWSARVSAPQMQIRLTASYHPTDSSRVSPSTCWSCLIWSSVGVVSGGRPPLANRENRSPESQRDGPEEGFHYFLG